MRRVLFAMLVATAVGCSKDSTGPTAAPSAGTYTLQSIAGQRLPLDLGQGALTIVADSLTIADGGTWSEITVVRVTQNGQTMTDATDDNGTWARSGSTLTLTSVNTNSVVYSGSFSANELDLSLDGAFSYVFTK